MFIPSFIKIGSAVPTSNIQTLNIFLFTRIILVGCKVYEHFLTIYCNISIYICTIYSYRYKSNMYKIRSYVKKNKKSQFIYVQ